MGLLNALSDPQFWGDVNSRATGLLGPQMQGLNQFAGLLSGTVTPQNFLAIRAQQLKDQFAPQNALASTLGLLGTTVYHGSPYKFDAFDASKIGTGEGAQAYGHGLYFAENPGVAKSYAEGVLDMNKIDAANKRMSELAKIMERDSPSGYRQFKSDVGRNAAAEYDALMAAKMEPGSLYKVDIPDSATANMLHWDLPLSQQPQAVKSALRTVGIEPDKYGMVGSGAIGPNDPARVAYSNLAAHLGGSERASAALQRAGIPGIKYLDGGSRSAGQGTHNYVLFDPSIAKIVGRN